MNKIKTVIIDDEYHSRDLIKLLINKININFEVIGQAESVESGIKLIETINPSVVFLDIKMSDGSGFDLLNQLKFKSFEVVFITGFDEYALKAFEFNALDYVLKPIDSEKFENTLNRVYNRVKSNLLSFEKLDETLSIYDETKYLIEKIPVHVKDRVELLNIVDIYSIQSDDGCTIFTNSDNLKYVSSKQLSAFEFILEKFEFMLRINRSTYINIKHIKSYSKGEPCIVQLYNNCTFEVSRRKKGEILSVLSGFNL